MFARYLVENGLAEPGELAIATRAGVVGAVVDGDGIAARLRKPRVYGESTARVAGARYLGACVDVGNPHLVCRLADGMSELGPLDLSTSPEVNDADFPAGVNVEFMAPGIPVEGADLHVRMRVYERGSGETLSCGSGACAVAMVALCDSGRTAGRVAVDVPGGRLLVTIDENACWLAGPAVIVASGTVDPTAVGVALPTRV